MFSEQQSRLRELATQARARTDSSLYGSDSDDNSSESENDEEAAAWKAKLKALSQPTASATTTEERLASVGLAPSSPARQSSRQLSESPSARSGLSERPAYNVDVDDDDDDDDDDDVEDGEGARRSVEPMSRQEQDELYESLKREGHSPHDAPSSPSPTTSTTAEERLRTKIDRLDMARREESAVTESSPTRSSSPGNAKLNSLRAKLGKPPLVAAAATAVSDDGPTFERRPVTTRSVQDALPHSVLALSSWEDPKLTGSLFAGLVAALTLSVVYGFSSLLVLPCVGGCTLSFVSKTFSERWTSLVRDVPLVAKAFVQYTTLQERITIGAAIAFTIFALNVSIVLVLSPFVLPLFSGKLEELLNVVRERHQDR